MKNLVDDFRDSTGSTGRPLVPLSIFCRAFATLQVVPIYAIPCFGEETAVVPLVATQVPGWWSRCDLIGFPEKETTRRGGKGM